MIAGRNIPFARADQNPAPFLDREEARELGVANHVKFTGFVSQRELHDFFLRSHMFLHPSETGADGNQEGVPNSMLEAMASGLPVFATTHGGIPEAIENGVSGVLVGEGDAGALARELMEAAEKPEFLGSLAKNGAAAVAEKFEQRAQVRQLEDCYFEALAARR
jgi:glycosyltransferase involved in cell wall biosynthesis